MQGDRIAQQMLDDFLVLPENVEYLWDSFLELHLTRRNYGYGAMPIEYKEILAWKTLRGIKLDGWELDAILGLDGIYLSEQDEGKKPNVS